jgi:hypothetical protein
MAGTPEVIEVRVAELRQLFNAMDPAPFRERDLDPRAEEFIVEWAREARRDAPLSLLVVLDRRSGVDDQTALLTDAVHQFFAERARASRRRLKRLFHIGRISLLIGVALLAALIGIGELLANRTGPGRLADILHESLVIGGWVAMWRPLEVFLYDWWPIRGEARLYDRLAAMPVSIRYPEG